MIYLLAILIGTMILLMLFGKLLAIAVKLAFWALVLICLAKVLLSYFRRIHGV